MKPLDFDIAFRLKKAGFPQPEPDRWQSWVTETGEVVHIDKRLKYRVRFRSFGIEPQKGADGRFIVERCASADVLSLRKWYYLPSFTELSFALPIFGVFTKASYARKADYWIKMKQSPDKFDKWAEKYLNKILHNIQAKKENRQSDTL